MKRLRFIGSVLSVAACAICALFLYALCRAPLFRGEGYEIAYGTSSSCKIARTEDPFLIKLTGAVAGESARFEGDRSEELLTRFRAKVLFTEEACGVVNYYCYSPLLGDPIELCGERVNLHVACSLEMTAAGSPVIFGGF